MRGDACARVVVPGVLLPGTRSGSTMHGQSGAHSACVWAAGMHGGVPHEACDMTRIFLSSLCVCVSLGCVLASGVASCRYLAVFTILWFRSFGSSVQPCRSLGIPLLVLSVREVASDCGGEECSSRD